MDVINSIYPGGVERVIATAGGKNKHSKEIKDKALRMLKAGFLINQVSKKLKLSYCCVAEWNKSHVSVDRY